MIAKRLITAVRRNHALEHATVAVLLGRLGPTVRLVGRAAPNGFYIYGRIPTDTLETSAREGLSRLQAGEAGLAVTPFCGTNIAVAGVLAGTFSMLTMRRGQQLSRIPNVFIAAMAGVVLSQPLGRLLQKYVTTEANLGGTNITSVRRSLGGWMHKVQTASR